MLDLLVLKFFTNNHKVANFFTGELMKSDLSVIAFWIVVILLISIVAVFYVYPAEEKLDSLTTMYEKTDSKCEKLSKSKQKLEQELIALDDPFYIEKLLRCRYNWKPINKTERLGVPISKSKITPINPEIHD